MSSSHLYCMVMAGGKGTRFWPESTSKRPKQYLSLVSEQSLLAETLDRFDGLVESDKRFIVTVKEQAELADSNSQGKVGSKGLIFEPSGRNTAPCILLGLVQLKELGASDEDIVAIVPADHVILNKNGFQGTIKKAAELAASKNKIVTIGITPNFPHTGYGYIQKGEEVLEASFDVAEFKEKPNVETAKEYVASGQYLWNAGMFMGKIGVLMQEFEKHASEIFAFASGLKENLSNFEKLTEVYNQIPSDSIDYAIMEKSSEVMVVPAQFDWNDLGSWDALESVIEKKDENIIASARDFYGQNAKGNIVFAPDKFVSLVNVDDLIVVSNENAVVVLPKSDSQEVKKIVGHIKTQDSLKDLE